MNKKYLIVIAIIVILLSVVGFIFLGNAGSGGLSGKFGITGPNAYEIVFEFSGNAFTLSGEQYRYPDGRLFGGAQGLGGIIYVPKNDWDKGEERPPSWDSATNRYFTTKGKYSITDNKIEFVYSDGKIEIYSFSRTENTITVAGEQLNRL